jgi:hypothetical protein
VNRRQVLGLLGGLATTGVPTARARQSGYGPNGRVEIDDATEAVVRDDGRTAFVAVGSGFVVVDISDPTAPSVVAERHELLADREDGPMAGIIDLKVDGDRLVVPGPGNPTRDVVSTGFALFDISEPSAPERVAFHETPSAIHNAFVDDGRVYLTQGPVVDIIDIADDDPEAVGTIALGQLAPDWSDVDIRLRAAHDVWVRDRIAYVPVWDAGTLVVDVEDPASPSLLAHIEGRSLTDVAAVPDGETRRAATEPPGNHHYAQASDDGRLLAIGKESWDATAGDGTGGPSGIELWDIAEPTEPIKLSEIHPPRAKNETPRGTWTTAHNFDLVGDRLYSSWYQGGVKIHDVSDPGDPTELAWWRRPEEAAFWTAALATEAYFIASSAGGIAPTITPGLFTFPTESGEQADPPSTPAPATPPSAYATPRPTPSPTPTDSDGQPGFGFLGGLAGLAAGLWWRRRGRDDRP